MLGRLYQQDETNRMAYEYLMAYCLLTKELQAFITYYPLGKSLAYPVVPRHFQEALWYSWNASNNDASKTMPYPISEDVKRQMTRYQQRHRSTRASEEALRKEFGHTYWYYLHFRK